ncbi:hypothetical protein CMUS01_06207 [Colletotrichum musicola]|uniref:Uncharacterized protein n=1 Tax=Colletotrichum musicola TaxID=2175873 RepID=A0A8H6NIQ6_9PEZI|nr:hypothetical protein CMUS01_06207 [Colletotrichum musicola]
MAMLDARKIDLENNHRVAETWLIQLPSSPLRGGLADKGVEERWDTSTSKKLGIEREFLQDRNGAEASFAAASELLSQPHFPVRLCAGPTNPTTQAMLITPPGRKYDTAEPASRDRR